MHTHTKKYHFMLQSHKKRLLAKYPIKSMALFGSVSRMDFNENSDIDVLIELNGEMDWTYFDLVNDIKEIFKPIEVDVVVNTSIPNQYWKYIENDLNYV